MFGPDRLLQNFRFGTQSPNISHAPQEEFKNATNLLKEETVEELPKPSLQTQKFRIINPDDFFNVFVKYGLNIYIDNNRPYTDEKNTIPIYLLLEANEYKIKKIE
jgi:hypothetical protein